MTISGSACCLCGPTDPPGASSHHSTAVKGSMEFLLVSVKLLKVKNICNLSPRGGLRARAPGVVSAGSVAPLGCALADV